jgi:hypothetical protein
VRISNQDQTTTQHEKYLTLKTGALSVLSYPPNTTSNNYQVSKTFSHTYKEKEEENTLIVYEKILKNLDDTPNRYAPACC